MVKMALWIHHGVLVLHVIGSTVLLAAQPINHIFRSCLVLKNS